LDGGKTTHLGAVMIFATSLPGFKSFLGQAADRAADFGHVVAFVACFILPAARRSVKAAARSVRSEFRDAGNLLRFLGGSRSPSVLLAAAQTRLLRDRREGAGRLHLLILDSTQHTQHGAEPENSFSRGNTKRRPKQSARKQKKHHRKGCHTFVFALLLCPCGLRVPYWLPFFTKEYCRLRGWRRQTQADLAAQLVRGLPLADGVPVIVVGDTAFEAKQVRQACAKRKHHWIAPVNPERVLAGASASERPKVLSLVQGLKARDFRRVSFRLDEGPLAPLARVSPGRVRSSKHHRAYWVHRRAADVHSVGGVVLLFSNKQDPSQTPAGVTAQKVLMSDAKGASAEQLLRRYALRWQVELFFKEMKQDLGMCQYKTGRFERVAGWVGLCVLSFRHLEHRRSAQLQQAGKQERPYWAAARAQALRAAVRREVERADVLGLIRCARTADGRRRLNELLQDGYDDAAEPRDRRRVA
jgi:hypothetical protein